MGNVFDEMHSIGKNNGAAADHKTGTVSAAAATVELGPGWWKISCSVDYHWLVSSTSVNVTTATGTHEWAYDTPDPILVPLGETRFISVIRSAEAGADGKYYFDRIKGA